MVIVVVLVSIGDIGTLIEQTTSQNQLEDFGIVKNCNPSSAVCSVSGFHKGKRIRFSLNIDEPITTGKQFPVNLYILGIDTSQIKKVNISLDMPGVDTQINQKYFQMRSNNHEKLTSQWHTQLTIHQSISERKDWLARIQISLDKQIIQLAFQLQVKPSG
jgi:hypothetical protein